MKRAIAAALILFASMVQAQELEVGAGLICDTQKQIERFAELLPSQKGAAIATINDEEKSSVCAIANIVYNYGDVVGHVEIDGVLFKIVSISVIAVKLDNRWVHLQPIQQFTLMMDTDKKI